MKTVFDSTWPRRVAPLVLGALITAGALVLVSLVLELQDPLWTRPAIIMQLLAGALASAALRAHWPLSRRFVVYPLILILVMYLWDTTLPPPSLPDGLLRGVAPRLVLLALLIDLVVWQGRNGLLLAGALVRHFRSIGATQHATGVQKELRLDPARRNGQLGPYLGRPYGRPHLNGIPKHMAVGASAPRVCQNLPAIAGAAPKPSNELPHYLPTIFGITWLILTTIVAIPPGIELGLIEDGQAPSAAIFACLQPWVGWVVAGSALLNFLTLFLAVWVLPALRRSAALATIGGAVIGVSIGLLIGVPCG